MGLRLFSDGPTTVYVKQPNPDPHRFNIKKLEPVGFFTVALINYPDCTTYGGDKILVYYCQPHHIQRQKAIDPHFLDGTHLSPIARFPAHDKGWEHAIMFCKALQSTETRD